MSGKRMKALRRQAEAQTVGQPDKAYRVLMNDAGARQVRLHSRSTRGAYKRLKESK